MSQSLEQQRANRRLGLALALVALVFALGFFVRLAYFGR